MNREDFRKSDSNRYADIDDLRSRIRDRDRQQSAKTINNDIKSKKSEDSKENLLGILSIILSIIPCAGTIFGIAGVISSNRKHSSEKNRILSFIGIGLSSIFTLAFIIVCLIFVFKDKINLGKKLSDITISASKNKVEEYWKGYSEFDTDKMEKCFNKDFNVEITQHLEKDSSIKYKNPVISLVSDSNEENGKAWSINNPTDKKIKDYKIFSISAKYEKDGVEGICIGQATVVHIGKNYYLLEEPSFSEINNADYEAEVKDEDTTEKETSVINMLIGMPDIGYCEVPNDFLQFHDYDSIIGANKYFQYADVSGKNVVSMAVYDKNTYSLQDRYGAVTESLKNEGISYTEDSEKAGQYDTKTIKYENNNTKYQLMFFEVPDDDFIHEIRLQYTEEYENLYQITDTYTLTVDER